MTPDQNKQAVIQAWKSFANRDPKLVGEAFTPDAEWLAPAENATAVALHSAGHMVGRERIVRFLTQEFQTLFVADVKVDWRSLFAEGDTVIMEHRFQGMLANGSHYDNDYAFFIEMKNGQIHRVREYMDTQRGAKMIFGDTNDAVGT
jgi:ketosteroid isomerase-like protein